MDYSQVKHFIADFKSSHSCADFLSQNGIPCREGQTIRTPSFIRTGDSSPSFAVYASHCIDFATNSSYSIFDLDMLLNNRSFSQSFEALTGRSLRADTSASQGFRQADLNRQKLRENIIAWHDTLLQSPEALEYLHKRKISDETIEKFLIGYNPSIQRIIFPYFKKDINSRDFVPAYYVARDITGQFTGSGKYKKAQTGWGISNIPWGLNTLRTSLPRMVKYTGSDGQEYDTDKEDPKDITLIICEGTVDALVFAQEGWQVLSPCGGSFPRTQRPFILDTCRRYKRVFICFDNDPRGEMFRQEWVKLLFEHRIPFICGHTAPAGSKEDKLDVADYYVRGGSLDKLVADAESGIAEYGRSLNTYEDIAEAFRSAARFAEPFDLDALKAEIIGRWELKGCDKDGNPQYAPKFDAKRVRYLFNACTASVPDYFISNEVLKAHMLKYNAGDSFYEYGGGIWKAIPDIFVEQYVLRALGRLSSARKNSSVMRYIQQLLAEQIEFDAKPVITLKNCTLLLDEQDESGRQGKIVPHSPEYMCTIRVPVSYDPQASCPRWKNFIREVTGGDAVLMRLFQKSAGYILFPGNSMQKFFYLIGAGANGKSTFLQILSEVFGEDNGSFVRPDRMGDQFAPMAMKGKLYNICYEAGAYLKGSEESMKAIVSSDTIMAAHKGVDAVAFRPRAKVFMASNGFFNARDVSWGFLRRILFLPFDQTFDPQTTEAQSLMSSLRDELPGIFNWCLEGYRMLSADQGFEETKQQAELMEKFVEQIDPITAFYREKLSVSLADNPTFSQGDQIISLYNTSYPTDSELYRYYTSWCKENGHKPVCKAFFREKLAAAAKSMARFDGLEPIELRKVKNRYYFIVHELDATLEDAVSLQILAENAQPAQKRGAAECEDTPPKESDVSNLVQCNIPPTKTQEHKALDKPAPEPYTFDARKLDPSYTPTQDDLEYLVMYPLETAETLRKGAGIFSHLSAAPQDWPRLSDTEGWPYLMLYMKSNPVLSKSLPGYEQREHEFLMRLWRSRTAKARKV